jgi:hypothetical protein
MIRRAMVVLGVGLALALVGGTSAQAKAPLYGDLDTQFNLGWPGYQEEIPDWVGTVTIDGQDYGTAFFLTGTGKPFAEQPPGGVLFFEETWVVYEELDFAFDDTGVLVQFEPGDVLLSGYDRGVMSAANAAYRMNGDVSVANGPFADWLGRSVHMGGVIEFYDFGLPYRAPVGTIRIN